MTLERIRKLCRPLDCPSEAKAQRFFCCCAARLNRVLKNSEHKMKRNETVPQGLKAVIDLMNLTYGLKFVPFKTRPSPAFFSSL
jgi:hypothetical protein